MIIAISTTICPVSGVTATSQATKTPQTSSFSKSPHPTVSTVITTHLVTIIQCPPIIPNCPATAKQTMVLTRLGTEGDASPGVTEAASQVTLSSQFIESAHPIQPADSRAFVSASASKVSISDTC